jgi:hypothetical protein
MSSINLIQAKPFTLLEPIGTTEAEISVKNLVTIYGDQVEMSGTEQFATLEPTSLDNQEIISYTDIVIISDTISKLTGVTRWLDAQPDPITGLYSSSPTQAKSHAGGVIGILSDNPQVWDKKTSKDEDETVTGNWTFDEPLTIATPVAGTDAVTKDYADGLTYTGTPDASTTVKGASRLSASPTVTLGTCTITIATPGVITLNTHGLTLNDSVEFTTTGTLPTGIVASTKYFVISAWLTANAFQISATLGGTAIDTSVGQSGTHTLYKTTPVSVWVNDNRVSPVSLASVTADIVAALEGTGTPNGTTGKYVTNDDTATAATANKVARRLAGGNITVVTESQGNNTTNAASTAYVDAGLATMVISMTNGTTTKNLADSSTTQNIAHGLGEIPKYIRLNVVFWLSNALPTTIATLVYNGTTSSVVGSTGTSSTRVDANSSGNLQITGTSSSTDYQTGVVTMDATNIIITWTKQGSPTGTVPILWEAFKQ